MMRSDLHHLPAARKRLDLGDGDDLGGYVCLSCAEWRVAGCATHAGLERAEEAAEARYGACLACGSSWPMHGSPPPAAWRKVPALNAVVIVETWFVLARAEEIARGAHS